MRIAFIDPFPENETNSWVQTAVHIQRSLRALGSEVHTIDSVKLRPRLKDRFTQVAYRLVGKRFIYEREPDLLQELSDQLSIEIDKVAPDLILSPSSLAVSYLRTSYPVIVWTDSTFGGLVNVYDYFSNLCKRSLHNGHLAERKAMLNADLSVYSSTWASEFAADFYRIDLAKIRTVPLGANLADVPSMESINEQISERIRRKLAIVFVGFDWERKGGNNVLRVHHILNARGVPCTLHIIGCDPAEAKGVENVVVHGRLDKKNRSQRMVFDKLMKESHFLVLPSKADCTAIVLSEAAAYGLPVLTTDVGGHRSVINDGENGFLFDEDDTAAGMAARIETLHSDPDRYKELCLSSRRAYDERLSWDASCRLLMSLINDILVSDPPAIKRAG